MIRRAPALLALLLVLPLAGRAQEVAPPPDEDGPLAPRTEAAPAMATPPCCPPAAPFIDDEPAPGVPACACPAAAAPSTTAAPSPTSSPAPRPKAPAARAPRDSLPDTVGYGRLAVAFGAGWQELYGVEQTTGWLRLSLGADLRHVGFTGNLSLGAGGYSRYLPQLAVESGFSVEILVGRVRIGLGLRLGGLFVWRATIGTEARAHVVGTRHTLAVDIVRGERAALFLQFEAGLDLVVFGSDNSLDATGSDLVPFFGVSLGVRLALPPGRRWPAHRPPLS